MVELFGDGREERRRDGDQALVAALALDDEQLPLVGPVYASGLTRVVGNRDQQRGKWPSGTEPRPWSTWLCRYPTQLAIKPLIQFRRPS